MKIYTRPRETWTKAQCLKACRHLAKDGLGTPYPWKGYIGSHYGTTRYNGGIVRGGKWYHAETVLLPKIPKGFKIVHVPTWGYRIIQEK